MKYLLSFNSNLTLDLYTNDNRRVFAYNVTCAEAVLYKLKGYYIVECEDDDELSVAVDKYRLEDVLDLLNGRER